MKIGLLLNSNNSLCLYSARFKEIIIKNDLPYAIIDPNSYTLLDELKSCSHLIFNHSQGDTDIKIYEAIFNIAHRICGLKCSPNFETFWLYEDKIKEYYLLRCNDFPIIESHAFWNLPQAHEFLKKTEYPLIAKLPKGASSSNVVLINSAKDGEKIIQQVFNRGVKARRLNCSSSLSSFHNAGILKYGKTLIKNYLINMGMIKEKSDYPEWQIQKDAILFQKFLPDNKFDTRITVIGNRALAFRRFVRENDFRASGSGKIDVDPDKIDPRYLEIAFSISRKFHFNVMAYDFIYGEGSKPYINEISYCFFDYVVQSCPGYWDDNLLWHHGRNWPQHYQLMDFLHRKSLKTI